MAQAHSRDGNEKAGIEEVRLALDLDPNSPLALGVMGNFMYRSGNLDEAINFFSKAAAIDPLGAIWPANLIDLFFEARRFDEAEAALHKARELSPGSDHRAMMAGIHYERGQYEEALELTEALDDSANKEFGLMLTFQAMDRQEESDAAMKRLLS